ncbi:hypothetical protein K3G63_13675 [Hymenobacter sp. HSC-4F20]|uniref:hypothetical protein n=1 Tax=Hymenobacter sp. HSC-4F20 TaxID=2864135 RepID=UPI001C736865|nr:hypothetical protein [Hymenobacter sp. HSC-4F20]MBX0291494.1 hypothetical protein [Hymenobacter sp. HSC-4F20]
MSVAYSTLTDRAQCDAATAQIDFELRTFAVRDANLDLSDERATRTQTSTAAQLAKVTAQIASADAILAAPGIDEDTRADAADNRAALLVQQTRLQKRARQTGGLTEFLADVDAAQTAQQITLLTAIKDGIARHRATLPA